MRTGDVERNPGPETYVCPICGKEIKDRRQISVWCHLGGYVHMKCTSLRSIKGYSDEFVCDRCSWCKGEGGKREIRERRRTEKRKRREKVQKTRAEKREREAKTKGKGKATRVWTWNIQGARVSFPRRNRFAEILRCISKSNAEVVLLSELREKEEGMKWIKAKDMFGVLIHGKRSGIILRDEWALDWRDQGCKRTCGDRSSAVEVNQIKFVATYQPLWNSDRRDFDAYREELNEMIRCGAKKLVLGGDFNSSVGDTSQREEDDAVGPFGLGRTNAAGRDLIEWCHEQGLTWTSSFFRHNRRGTWKCPGRRTWHEIDGFMVKKKDRSRVVKSINTVIAGTSLSDHRPKCMEVWRRKGAKANRKSETQRKINWEALRDGSIRRAFASTVDGEESNRVRVRKVNA